MDTEPTPKKNVLVIISAMQLFLLLVLSLTLPFHYISYQGQIFMYSKDSLTFRDTFANNDDITATIDRYNAAETIWEKNSINNESLHKRLMEAKIIYSEKKEN